VRVRSGPCRVRVVEFSYNFVHSTKAANHYATPPAYVAVAVCVYENRADGGLRHGVSRRNISVRYMRP